MSLLRSSGILGRLRAINISLLTELKTGDDNPPDLMYKGKANQIVYPLIAYARFTHT